MILKYISLLTSLILFIFQAEANDKVEETSEKPNQLSASIQEHLFSDIEKALPYIDSLFHYAEVNNDSLQLSKAHNYLAIKHFILKDYEKAIDHYKISYQIAFRTKDIRREAIALSNIGLAYKAQHQYDSAIGYYSKALLIARSNGFEDLTAKNITELNYLMLIDGEFTAAAKYLFEAIDLGTKNNDNFILSYAYSGLGNLYHNLGNPDETIKFYKLALYYDSLTESINSSYTIYLNMGENYWNGYQNFDSAHYFNQKAIEVAPSNEKESISHALLVNYGNIYTDSEEYTKALENYNLALDHPYAAIYQDRKAIALVNKGFVEFKLQRYAEARTSLLNGLHLADSLQLFNPKSKAYYNLFRLDSLLGNYKTALNFYHLYHKHLIEMEKEDAKKNLAELSIKRELEKMKQSNEILKLENDYKEKRLFQQKMFQYLLLLIILGTILFTIIQLRNYRKIKNLNKKLLSQNTQIIASNEVLQLNNTLLAEQQNKLEQLNQTKDKFVSVLSHDLKSPFNSLLGILDLLNKDWGSFDEQEKQDLVRSLHKSTQNTYQLLEDLLVWGKSQQGLIKKHEETFKASEIIANLKNLLQHSANSKAIALETNCRVDFELKTDKRLLSQILQNFLSNAIKYTHRNGSVILKSEQIGKQIIFTVTDTGIGIPKDVIPKIFDLDIDFGRPGTEAEKSTGMGLILCKEFAKILGARLEASSEVGIGSVFSLVLYI